jgi:hypothetical protein
MKKSVIFLTVISAVIIFLSTCKHQPDIKPLWQNTVDTSGHHCGACNPDTVYFTNTILPMIISNCATAGCHDAATSAEGINLTNYNDIMRLVKSGNPNNSKLYRVMIETGGDVMPPSGRLPQSQIDLIYKWILQGAKNNYCNGDNGPCDSTNVSYSTTLVPIINTFCKGCHNSGNASQGVNLDNYQGVQAVALNGQLMGGLTGKLSPMPKYSLPLTRCDIAKFRQWIIEGAKNN